MKGNAKTTLLIGTLIVLAAAAGTGVFVSTGSQVAVWFVLIGIPTIVVGGITLYVRGTITRSGTSEQQYVRKRARAIGENVQGHVRHLNELEDAYPQWNADVDSSVESIAADLRTQGVDMDLETGAFQLTKNTASGDLQELERLANDSDRLRETIEQRFREFARDEIETLETTAERLEDADLARTEDLPDPPDDDVAVAEFRTALDTAEEIVAEAIDDAVSTAREIGRGETRPNDVDAELERAIEAVDWHEYDDAVDSILEACESLRNQYAGSFDAERGTLLELLETVNASGVDEYATVEQLDAVDSVESAVTDLDSALDLTALSRHRTQLRQTCLEIVETIEQQLAADVQTLRDATIPAGYYTEPPVVDESFVESLEAADDLETFTDRWGDVAEQLVDALDTASTKATVVEAYDDVAQTIESELEERGEVTAEELPVHHADQFFGLYYRRNPSIEFDPETPAIRRGSVETSDVDVEVTYEHGGPTRTATVELAGDRYVEEGTVETRVAGSTTFTDVPHGTYTISADPGSIDFAPIERESSVDGNTTVQLEFTEQGLHERLCADIDIDMESLLPDVSPRLESLFEEEGYVSTSMDLPVKESYTECLLATWAAETDRELIEAETEIIAFDQQRVEREFENVITYNIEPGEERSYEELRQNFLSVPLPDSVIRDVIVEIETEYSVMTTETAISVE